MIQFEHLFQKPHLRASSIVSFCSLQKVNVEQNISALRPAHVSIHVEKATWSVNLMLND